MADELRLSLLPVFAAASDPYERAEGRWFERIDTSQKVSNGRARRWSDAVAHHDHGVLTARGLEGGCFDKMLSDVRIRDEDDLPPWASMLLDVLAEGAVAQAVAPITADELQIGAHGLPWSRHAAHEPLLRAAVPRLAELRDSLPIEIRDGALRSLLVSLARRLNQVTAQTLESPPTFTPIDNETKPLLDLTVHEIFFSDNATDVETWIDVFQFSPVLARLIGVVWIQWWETVTELLDRLASDVDRLATTLNAGSTLGAVNGFSTGLSDRHTRGRTVTIVDFESGCRVVYKPRNLEVASAFMALVAEMNERGSPLELPPRPIITRTNYTWEGYVAQRDCADDAAVEQFYGRYGMLARLLQFLGGHDFTFENIRAHADYPVPIDLETLLRPLPRSLRERPDDGGLYIHWLESLAPSGLITCDFEIGPGQPFASASPLAPGSQLPPGATAESTPTRDGAPVDPRDHFDAVLDGYAQLDRWLRQNAKWVTARDGPLCAMRSPRVRLLHRSTQIYARLLEQSLQPSRLTDGVEREIELERLWRTLAADPNAGPLIEDEIASLRQLDVPLITCRPDATSACLEHNGEVDNLFDSPAIDRILASLTPDDSDAQYAFASSLLHCMDPRSVRWARPSTPGSGVDRRYHDAAIDIVRFIEAQSFRGADGSIGWIGADGSPLSGRERIRPISGEIYAGTAGLTVVVAEISAASDDPVVTELAHRLVDSLSRAIETTIADDKRPVPGAGGAVGGFVGLGSMLYAYSRSASAIGRAAAVQQVADAADHVDFVQYAASAHDDLATGRSGLVLNLLAIERRSPEASGLIEIACEVASGIGRSTPRTAPHTATGWASSEIPSHISAARLAFAALDARSGAIDHRPPPLEVQNLALHRGELLAAIALERDEPTIVEAIDIHLGGDVGAVATNAVVGRLEVALTAYELLANERYLDHARSLADELLLRRRTGSWFPDLRLDDRHNLSAMRGLGAVALCLSRVSRPGLPRSLRLID